MKICVIYKEPLHLSKLLKYVKMKAVEFSLRVTSLAQRAIHDFWMLDEALIQTSSNTYNFEDNEDEEIETALRDQMEAFGIEETEYEIY